MTHQFHELGDHNVVIEVRDSKGLVNSMMKTVIVKPSLPVIDEVIIFDIEDNIAYSV